MPYRLRVRPPILAEGEEPIVYTASVITESNAEQLSHGVLVCTHGRVVQLELKAPKVLVLLNIVLVREEHFRQVHEVCVVLDRPAIARTSIAVFFELLCYLVDEVDKTGVCAHMGMSQTEEFIAEVAECI